MPLGRLTAGMTVILFMQNLQRFWRLLFFLILIASFC